MKKIKQFFRPRFELEIEVIKVEDGSIIETHGRLVRWKLAIFFVMLRYLSYETDEWNSAMLGDEVDYNFKIKRIRK